MIELREGASYWILRPGTPRTPPALAGPWFGKGPDEFESRWRFMDAGHVMEYLNPRDQIERRIFDREDVASSTLGEALTRWKAGAFFLRPSTLHPGEKDLICPKCDSDNVVITSRFTGRGTGPEGRCRMGDPGEEILRCEACKHEARR